MKFFLPDWDDRVDPGYDFTTDRPTYDRDPSRDDIYVHEAFGEEPCCDGILISRSAISGKKTKEGRIDKEGLRRFFRLPAHYELIGDCGAFGYVDEPKPIYETSEVLAFYQRIGVDYGVSVDHIIFPAYPDQSQFRYQLTIDNARQFFSEHQEKAYSFTPVGAVQGWDVASYRNAARELAAAGFTMIAIGGLVRSQTEHILRIVEGVVDEVGRDVKIHLLGVARDGIIQDLLRLGIFSFDSASPMRTAWTSGTHNYLLADRSSTAIRIPYSDPSIGGLRGDNVLSRSSRHGTYSDLQVLERTALAAVKAYGRRAVSLDDTLAALEGYEEHQTRLQDSPTAVQARLDRYRRTLRDRPWDKCPCPICRQLGIEVVVFRGNNRNRRRGFHNVGELYRKLKGRERDHRDATEKTAAATS